MWIQKGGSVDIMSGHNMMIMNHECQGLEEKVGNRNKGYSWNMRGADWENYRKSLEHVEWCVDGAVDEMNDV